MQPKEQKRGRPGNMAKYLIRLRSDGSLVLQRVKRNMQRNNIQVVSGTATYEYYYLGGSDYWITDVHR